MSATFVAKLSSIIGSDVHGTGGIGTVTITKIALTMGDPAGIGPEITALALKRLAFWLVEQNVTIGYFGDKSLIPGAVQQQAYVDVHPVQCDVLPVAGQGDSANAGSVIASIERATASCVNGEHNAIVTNPINKAVLYGHGFAFPGHTEFLGHLCGCKQPTVMMLSAQQLSVVPITLHVSLYDAIAQIRQQGRTLIHHAVMTTAQALNRQGIARPRLAVSGLNPHAGEAGTMGTEERDIIAPAIAALAQYDNMQVTGPWPADTMFDAHNRQKYDAALAMTHDQALIPIKTLAFDSAVNVTLGLPIVRTSPDHGTAYDIAGRGVARPDSLIAAIKKAVQMARTTTT